MDLEVTRETVARERDHLRDRGPAVVALANDVRSELGAVFETSVDPITEAGYREVLAAVFADGAVGVNVATLARLLRGLDVAGDYPGFVVDELLGRELARTIAGGQPLRLLATATFHYADIHTDGDDAGEDDLEAALAAGVQTRLPGWEWQETDPFGL
jgi:hypothetical protein